MNLLEPGDSVLLNLWLFLAHPPTVIALCALVVSVYSMWTLKRHNYVSVKPWLRMLEDQEDSKDGNVRRISFPLENVGIGPAVLKSFTLLHNGEPVAVNNREKHFEFIKGLDNSFKVVEYFWLPPGVPLAAKEKQILLAFEFAISEATNKQADILISELGVVIEYTSLYEETTFIYDSRKDRQWHS